MEERTLCASKTGHGVSVPRREAMEQPTRTASSSHDQGIQSRAWAELPSDALSNIFGRLTLEQRLFQIPFVCKLWKLASRDPFCWQKVNINTAGFMKISCKFIIPKTASQFLNFLLEQRCQGFLRELRMPNIDDHNSLVLLASSAPRLEKLDIPDSCADDEWATYAAPLMPFITELNLNLSTGELSHVAVEAFGKSCKGITKLCINRRARMCKCAMGVDDSIAFAIARHYPRLRHLELRFISLSTQGLRAIMENCALLEWLDVTNFPDVTAVLDAALLSMCRSRLNRFVSTVFSFDDDVDDHWYGMVDDHWYEW